VEEDYGDQLGKDGLYKGILFAYALFERNGWGEVVSLPNGEMEFTYLPDPTPTKDQRIALVQHMMEKYDNFERLLQLASIDGDRDRLRGDGANHGDEIKNHIRRLLRFFALETSFGFARNMDGIIYSQSLQEWDNCFLIAACDLIDLQMQRDLPLSHLEKYQTLDKAQVAR